MPVLYVAGVSISDDPKDISPRTLSIVREASVVIGEERRSALRLINAAGSAEKELYLINEHSSDKDRNEAFEAVCRASISVFFSDAGTPCISDPDFKFIAMCRDGGIEVKALPGPSSVTAAISVSGIDSRRFYFAGFPPKSGRERSEFFSGIFSSHVTAVFMERPYALETTLRDMAKLDRPVSLSLDLGGENGRTLYGRPSELIKSVAGVKAPFVAVVPPAEKKKRTVMKRARLQK